LSVVPAWLLRMDFFDEPADNIAPPEIPRDEDGRPLITPPGGGAPIAYERASSLPNVVDNMAWLAPWRLQLAALGLRDNPHLLERLEGLAYGDPDLMAVINDAHDRAGGNTKANWGTDVHLAIQPDTALADVPGEMVGDVTAYHCALEQAGVKVLDSEVFVVNDDLQVGGTLDALYDIPGLGVVVGDAKTGTFHPMSCAVQIAAYAGGQRYNPQTGERTPLWDSLNTQRGVVARIPRQGSSCTLTPVRIDRGRHLARLAVQLLTYQQRTVDAWCEPDIVKVTRRDCLTARINAAPDRATLEQLWRDTPKAVWTAAHDTAAKARIAALAGAAA
jgi:hypothetical protein